MSDLSSLAYFCPAKETFWTWSENGAVVTWVSGRTIAFRPELDRILETLVPIGFPHLDTVLLLVAACRDGWRQNGAEVGLLTGLARSLAKHEAPPGARIADLLSIGAYKPGSDPDVDRALLRRADVDTFLRQNRREVSTWDDTRRALISLATPRTEETTAERSEAPKESEIVPVA